MAEGLEPYGSCLVLEVFKLLACMRKMVSMAATGGVLRIPT
jgi:hypothetical protein